MGHLFKHAAVRLWAALFLGSSATLILLPPFAGTLGPSWMIGPAVGLIAIAYWLVGISFAYAGRRRFNRLLEEALTWERAGMDREARQALSRAGAVVDSFLLSPFVRKDQAKRLLARRARFQMAQGDVHHPSDSVVVAYLRQAPEDREAAIQWLEEIAGAGDTTSVTDDIAVRIGQAHPDDPTIHRLLARFYISQRRCDLTALQTYTQIANSETALSEGLIEELAALFISERRAGRLALKVFLKAYEGDHSGEKLLAGIAACCRDIPFETLPRPLREEARDALSDMDTSRCAEVANEYLPDAADGIQKRRRRFKTSRDLRMGPLMQRGFMALAGVGAIFSARVLRILRAINSPRGRWIGMGLATLAVGWLAVSTVIYLSATFRAVDPAPKIEAKTITDPFTLQVAAYLKEADAQRYVDQLIGHGLDAYWTRAVGTHKTWYQVRVSHFKTKANARAMGEDLKARRLIGDFYVANYRRPDAP
ncbi:MAG: hypothetical protein CR984_03675 [Proteobacteria bacterium]|nr:MAG: hypothetical protein CR984_03675 [Pseudomonadota bacterium]PIE67967.1 MAG: hypothetical protein CSA23_01225 [Deltaproteobacteria bacterium]